MAVGVPSLEGSLFLTDPQSIIAYQWRKYCRTPKDTIPLLDDQIISLRWQVSRFGTDPEALTTNMQRDLQSVFTRIFGEERDVRAVCTYTMTSSNTYDVLTQFTYSLLSGEISSYGLTISLKNGELVIPEDNLANFLS